MACLFHGWREKYWRLTVIAIESLLLWSARFVLAIEPNIKNDNLVGTSYELYKLVRHRSYPFFSLQFDLCEPADIMYEPHLLAPPQQRPRSTRSHSLKSMSTPNLLTHRKRINSLPSKPVIPPYIIIQGNNDIQDSNSDEEELRSESSNESMGKWTEKGVFLIIIFFFSLFWILWMTANLMLGYEPCNPIQGGIQILLFSSCYRKRYKLRPDGPGGSCVDLAYPYLLSLHKVVLRIH